MSEKERKDRLEALACQKFELEKELRSNEKERIKLLTKLSKIEEKMNVLRKN